MTKCYVVQRSGSEYCDDTYIETAPPNKVFTDKDKAKEYKSDLEKLSLIESIQDNGWGGGRYNNDMCKRDKISKLLTELDESKRIPSYPLDTSNSEVATILGEILKTRWPQYTIFESEIE